MAKTQLLQITANIAPRSIYCSGLGSTAAGLTATVTKVDDAWELRAGAIVLADKGILCLDEAEKMNAIDRVAIHEAMESHSVSINKAGINARLNARTAVLAAANPDFGRYDVVKTIGENIKKLPVTLLTRFDLMFIMKDKVDEFIDRNLSSHILGKNVKEFEGIDRDLIKKYIGYARMNCHPQLDAMAMDYIQTYYMEIREESRKEDTPVSITPRQLESLIRITEAHAKIALKEVADITDAEAAVNIMKKSFYDVLLDQDHKIDVDRITGMSHHDRKKIMSIFDCMEKGEVYGEDELERKVKQEFPTITHNEYTEELNKLKRMYVIYSPEYGKVSRY